MSQYIADPFNAHRRQNLQLLVATNSLDSESLIWALGAGGGGGGSDELINLVAALDRTHPTVEIVKSVGRGGGNPKVPGLNLDWSHTGLPPSFRAALIVGLQSGAIVLRRKGQRGSVGRPPSSLFGPEALDGSRIATLQREQGISAQEATDQWILESRNGRKLRTQKEVDTWGRKARRARAAWLELERMAREMDN